MRCKTKQGMDSRSTRPGEIRDQVPGSSRITSCICRAGVRRKPDEINDHRSAAMRETEFGTTQLLVGAQHEPDDRLARQVRTGPPVPQPHRVLQQGRPGRGGDPGSDGARGLVVGVPVPAPRGARARCLAPRPPTVPRRGRRGAPTALRRAGGAAPATPRGATRAVLLPPPARGSGPGAAEVWLGDRGWDPSPEVATTRVAGRPSAAAAASSPPAASDSSSGWAESTTRWLPEGIRSRASTGSAISSRAMAQCASGVPGAWGSKPGAGLRRSRRGPCVRFRPGARVRPATHGLRPRAASSRSAWCWRR